MQLSYEGKMGRQLDPYGEPPPRAIRRSPDGHHHISCFQRIEGLKRREPGLSAGLPMVGPLPIYTVGSPLGLRVPCFAHVFPTAGWSLRVAALAGWRITGSRLTRRGVIVNNFLVAGSRGLSPHTLSGAIRFRDGPARTGWFTAHEVVVLTGVEPVHPGFQAGALAV